MKKAPRRTGKRTSSSYARLGQFGSFASSILGFETLEDRRLLSADPLNRADAGLLMPVAVSPLVGTSSPGGFTPAQIRQAYGIDQIAFSNGAIQGNGSGQTIAIVTAYHNNKISSDLAAFDSYFNIAPPSSFVQVAQDGTTNYQGFDPTGSFELETALDVEWSHAIAPAASILLVEANTSSFNDLVAAADYARKQPGVSVVSMSFGGSEFSGQNSFDATFTTPAAHAGVTFVAAAGDSGNPGLYPAYSPNVLSVGGTSLTYNIASGTYSETGWSGSGGGVSTLETQPSFQTGYVSQSTTMRVGPDVAFDANPNTGVPVYDTYNNAVSAPWSQVGGTSLGAPAWAGLIAIANQGRAVAGLSTLDGVSGTLPKLYSLPSSAFNDVATGSNGANSSAGPGFDTVTGRGSPKANLVVAGLIGPGAISGTVFNDANGNGTLDNGEAGLSGWTVYQDFNNNGSFDPIAVNTFNSADVFKTIGTSSTVRSNNLVSGLAANIVDVNVTLSITDTRDSDLSVVLISPNNTRIPLVLRAGGDGQNFTNTTFDDSASIAIASGSAPFSGSFRPAGPLAALNGSAPNGTWQLEIVNASSIRTGTLNSWSLQLTSGDPSTTSSASGAYQFASLAAGAYQVREVQQATFGQTLPAAISYNLTVSAANNPTGQNFGNQVVNPTSAPSAVSLLAASDTGISNSDRITKLNNSSSGVKLQFQVSGTVAGATVNIYSDGSLIGSATAAGSSTTVTTDGSSTLTDNIHSITARQTALGQSISVSSPSLAIQIDTVRPTGSIATVTPNTRTNSVSTMTIQYSEPVSGLALSDLQLTRNAGANLLSGAQMLSSADMITWTIGNLSAITSMAGSYELDLNPASSPVSDLAGNLQANTAGSTFTVVASVLNRLLFYNNSFFDNPSNDPSFNDDTAIATDKSAYLPGSGTSGFANYSTYDKGINGLMVDLTAGAGNHPALTASDFTFKTSAQGLSGQSSDPTDGSWTTLSGASLPTVIDRPGQGVGGSDRIELIWPDGTIVDRWLEVIVKNTVNTGLAAQDVFFYGNLPGDTNDDPTGDFKVIDATDQNNIKIAATNPLNTGLYFTYSLAGAISNLWDINRDGDVNANDQLAAKVHSVSPYGELDTINIAAAGPFAPVTGGAGATAAVPSALASTSSGLIPGQVAKGPDKRMDQPRNLDLRQTPVVMFFEELGRESNARPMDHGFALKAAKRDNPVHLNESSFASLMLAPKRD